MNILISINDKFREPAVQMLKSLSLHNNEFINVIASDPRVQKDSFVENNRRIILDTFKDISDNSLDEDIILKSTTGKLIIHDNCDIFTISDTDKKIFSFEDQYAGYDENSGLSILSSLTCNYPKLGELLMDEKNILALYQHIHIYEDDLPKQLIKKLTNS